MKVDIDGLMRLLAKPCCGACVIKATEAALPALIAEAEAGRKLREAIRRGYGREDLDEYDAAVSGCVAVTDVGVTMTRAGTGVL